MTDHNTSAIDTTLHVGDEVLTADGHRLGTVKELTRTHFKVDASMRTDYWLPRAEVASVDERVHMNWNNDEADRHELPDADLTEEAGAHIEPDDQLAEHNLNEAARSSMYRSRFGV